jgi:hypothetical protein
MSGAVMAAAALPWLVLLAALFGNAAGNVDRPLGCGVGITVPLLMTLHWHTRDRAACPGDRRSGAADPLTRTSGCRTAS